MKHILFFFLLIALFACQENVAIQEQAPTNSIQDNTVELVEPPAEFQDSIHEQITVMVVPCSNGYDYDSKMGDVNPSLEKYLRLDKRISLLDFPYKKMKGSGYFGVYDKKYCSEILKRVEVDFLILTEMKGLDVLPTDNSTGNWGYATKVLNAKTMNQFSGIHAEKLASFEKIDDDVEHKTDALVEQILSSAKSN